MKDIVFTTFETELGKKVTVHRITFMHLMMADLAVAKEDIQPHEKPYYIAASVVLIDGKSITLDQYYDLFVDEMQMLNESIEAMFQKIQG